MKRQNDDKRKKLEQSLQESEEKFAKIFQFNAAAITLARLRDGMILDVNEKWQEIFGRKRKEVVGKTTARDFIIWKDPTERTRAYKDLKLRRSIQNRECELLRKNGERWTGLFSAEVIQMQGEPVIISSLMDITERKRTADENLSLAKFPSENPNPVLRLTPKGALLYANRAARGLLGLGKNDREVALPAGLLKAITQAYSARHARSLDFAFKGRIFAFDIMPIPGEEYVNLYGRDETEHRLDEDALRANEIRYRNLFEKMDEGFALHEIICNKQGVPVDYRFLEINPAFEELTGLKRETVLGHRFSDVLPGEDPSWIRIFGAVALTGKPAQFENYSETLKRNYRVVAFAPKPGQFAVLFTDISEERQRQAELQKLNRTLKALSDSSQAMMQATAEEEFLAETCRIIVNDCGHKMAWIGYKENDKEKSIRPVAHAGFENGYLETLRLTWASTERGRGPTGTAIRTGKPVICRNMLRDPRFAPWREDARKRGYFSSISLPLLVNGRAIGAIAIYSQSLDPFSEAEVELLSELARRLTFGIQALRLRREKSKAEEALQETSNYLEKLLNYANAPIVVWDPSLHIARFNHAFERLTGYAARQVIGKPLDMLFPAVSKGESLQLIQDTLKGRHWEVVEVPILQKGGAIRTVLWNSANILDKHGTVVATIAQGQDISERKQAQEALQKSESMLHGFFDSLGIGRAIIEVSGSDRVRFVVSNQEVAKQFGLSAEAMKGKSGAEVGLSRETARLWVRHCRKCQLNRNPITFETMQPGPKGPVWNSLILSYLGEQTGRRQRCSLTVLDISERKRMEQALLETTDYLEKLLNFANAPIIVWDPDFRVIRFNRAFERLTGHEAAQVIGQPLDMLFPAASRNESLQLIRDALKGRHGEVVEIPILQKKGALRTVLWNSANIQDKNGAVIATIAQGQDISERKLAEQKLKDSLEMLRIAQNQAKAGLWSWNIASGELTWSNEFFQLFGLDPASGSSFDIWLATIHPDDREKAMAQVNKALEKRIPLSNEYRIVLPGGEQRWMAVAGNTSYDHEGKPLRMSGICIDSTERKLIEKRMEDSLIEKETLLRELHHRTKNNMNVISSLVALQSSTVSDLNVQRMFNDMQSRIRTMSLVHEKLYQSPDLSDLDMREYVGDLARTILAGYKNSAPRITLDLDIENVAFSIDAAIPCGLIINELMTNSLKYAFPEMMTGRIGIALRMPPGGEAILRYCDNGIGFPAGFDPLKATSLGLRVVQNLAKKQLQGKLEFMTTQGAGAVITFKKPAINRQEKI